MNLVSKLRTFLDNIHITNCSGMEWPPPSHLEHLFETKSADNDFFYGHCASPTPPY